MTVSRRFIFLLLLGFVILGIGKFLGFTFAAFITYNIICIALITVDYFLFDSVKTVLVKRCNRENLSLFEKEEICFEVLNASDRTIYLELKDEIPEFYFKTDKKLMKGEVAPHSKKIFTYYVIPQKRGAFSFGFVHIKQLSRFKLCIRIFKINLNREYKIYPNLKHLKEYRLCMCNNKLQMDGRKNIKVIGRGTSFESLREYVYGDEYRNINWKATARLGKPIVNQYEPEKNQHVHIMIDTGRPMSYTIRGYRKLDLVVNTALILSDIVNKSGDQSSLITFNTEVSEMIMPGKGPGHRNQIMEALYHIDHTNLTSNYDEAFYYLKKKERHRSIVFMFTDFDTVEEAEEMYRSLPIISRNNIVVIVLITNESIQKISEAEVNNTEDLFNKGVALDLLNERRKLISILNKKGIFCIECPPEKLNYSVINKYIQVKNQVYL